MINLNPIYPLKYVKFYKILRVTLTSLGFNLKYHDLNKLSSDKMMQ